MPTAPSNLSSCMAIDISPEEIRTHLIRRIEGIYQWVGVGSASTVFSMLGSVDKKSLVNAIHQLSTRTGVELLDDVGQVITPVDNHGRGVDRVSLTWSLPSLLKVFLIGLIPAYSMNVGMRLIGQLPLEIVGQISSTDGRSDEEKLDVLLVNRPDVIMLIGGVDGGAERVVKEEVDLVARSLTILSQELRPQVVYAGNSRLSEYVRSRIEELTLISTAPNIQPTLLEADLRPASEVLADVCSRIWQKRFNLQTGLHSLAVDYSRPAKLAIDDYSAILAKSGNVVNGSIAIYLNGLSTAISANLDGMANPFHFEKIYRSNKPFQSVDDFKFVEVEKWSPVEIQPAEYEDQLAADVLYPGRLPVTITGSAIGGGITRTAGRKSWQQIITEKGIPSRLVSKQGGVDADLILIGGSKLYNRDKYGSILLDMLDILQPIGLADVYLDPEGVAAPLGALAHIEPSIAIHCLLSNTIPKLATVIAPAFHARENAKVMTLSIMDADDKKSEYEVNAGSLFSIPLEAEKTAEVRIVSRLGVNLGLRNNWKKAFTIKGSLLGIVIDARGRPLVFRKSTQTQQAWMKHNLERARELDK
jgi:hypothetical protein